MVNSSGAGGKTTEITFGAYANSLPVQQINGYINPIVENIKNYLDQNDEVYPTIINNEKVDYNNFVFDLYIMVE